MKYLITLDEQELAVLLLALSKEQELQQKIKDQTWAQTLTATA